MSLSFSCCASLSPQFPSQQPATISNGGSLEKVKNLLVKTGIPSTLTSPVDSLQKGNWVKLICGASFEDVADIRNLSLVYTLAGVDCIDCAAEASVVNAVHDGIRTARAIVPIRKPWVMISVNDNEDLHFRKAEFDPVYCPIDCSRPCEKVCPAGAISFVGNTGVSKGGVSTERCYGCGRCLPVCPYDKIRAVTYIRDVAATAELLKQGCIDAIEIHTSGRAILCFLLCGEEFFSKSACNLTMMKHFCLVYELRTQLSYFNIQRLPLVSYRSKFHLLSQQVHICRQEESFQELWNGLGESINKLRLVAVSLPDLGKLTVPAMYSIYATMNTNLQCLNLWQLDGRPMSGDIGRGATREAIKFAQHVASITDKPKGFLQLAGGTNAHTVEGLRREGLFQITPISENVPLNSSEPSHALISGVAFGGYARKIVGRVLSHLQSEHGYPHLENYPDYLLKALGEALSLVGTVKCYYGY